MYILGFYLPSIALAEVVINICNHNCVSRSCTSLQRSPRGREVFKKLSGMIELVACVCRTFFFRQLLYAMRHTQERRCDEPVLRCLQSHRACFPERAFRPKLCPFARRNRGRRAARWNRCVAALPTVRTVTANRFNRLICGDPVQSPGVTLTSSTS